MTEQTKTKVYRKCKAILIIRWIISFFFVLPWIILLCAESEGTNSNKLVGVLLILFWVYLFLRVFLQTLTIYENWVIIKTGVIFIKKKDLKYKKINSIESTNTLWFQGIKFCTWNDTVNKFTCVEKCSEIIEEVNKHIEE